MLVRGENVLVAEYIALVDAWVLYGCARSCSFTVSTAFVETSIVGQGKWETSLPTKNSFSGSLEGLVNLEETNLLSLADLRQRQIEQTPLLIRYQRTDEAGNVYTEEGTVYISSSTDDGPFDNMDSFSVELKGSGALTQVFTPAEILANMKRFQYTGVGDETVITAFTDVNGAALSLVGKTVLGFEKDGIGFSKQLSSGTPSDKEYVFNSGAGSITVAIPFSPGEEAFGYYR